ncbi:hypothetical protein TSAR_007539 [Trichomalopsis sarcophagae]|uniref:Uncharacterized protein n=1 Tax=Trichomalopsis sarcophagae TaxID=543379 RepID=A0A232EEG4_9HYME|nr:hypothetical protein TSAR_007539 [Trichomalopsis sarcophagae]
MRLAKRLKDEQVALNQSKESFWLILSQIETPPGLQFIDKKDKAMQMAGTLTPAKPLTRITLVKSGMTPSKQNEISPSQLEG